MTKLLENTQREFFDALLEPLRGSSRKATDFAPSDEPHSEKFFRTAERLVRPGPNLVPAEGLELYHRQYWFRLIDSLAEDFPGLRRLLGEERFWEMMEQSLLNHPSQSFTLRHLGKKIPEVVADSGDEFAESVARIEWAMMDAFEAAQLPMPEANNLVSAKIGLQPHVRVLDLPTSAGLWLDEDWGQRTDSFLEPSLVMVWRSAAGSVSQRTEDRASLPMVTALQRGGMLADLLQANEASLPQAEALQEWFGRWQQLGWLGVLNGDEIL